MYFLVFFLYAQITDWNDVLWITRGLFFAPNPGCLGNMTQTYTILLSYYRLRCGFAFALSKQRPLSYENIKVYPLKEKDHAAKAD